MRPKLEPSSPPLANPILAVDDHHGQPTPPPAKVARLGGGDDGVDDDDDHNVGRNVNAPGVRVDEAAASEKVGAEATVLGAPQPFSGDVPPDQPLLISNSSNPVKDEVEGGGGVSEEDGADRQKEADGRVDAKTDMVVVAGAVDNAKDTPPLPPLTGEGIYGLDEGVVVGKKSKKDRREFTAEEKLAIISEITTMPSVQSVLDKYGVSKSSLHRWRQPEKLGRLQEMVSGGGSTSGGGGDDGNDIDADSGGGHVKPTNSNGVVIENRDKLRKRDLHDKLRLIKLGLQNFCKENMNQAENERLAITSSLIQLKAVEIKEDLLSRGEIQDADELAAIEAFKASKSWACLMGNQLGYLSSGASIKWSDEQKTNTARYIEANSRKPSKKRKDRLEFTAEEKLTILQELENTNARNKMQSQPAVTVEQICHKYSTSKSSLHRWKQQYRSGRLQQLATTSSGYSNSKRISTDRLHLIKRVLNQFYIENENAPPDRKIGINYNVLQAKAIEARDIMLKRHHDAVMTGIKQLHEQEQVEELPKEEVSCGRGGGATLEEAGEKAREIEEGGDKSGGISSDVMSKEEANALEGFKASSSWLRETAKKFGWKLDFDGKRDSSADAVNDLAMISASTATDHQDHVHYHDNGGIVEDITSEHHAVGEVQHVHDEIAMEFGGMGNEVLPGIHQHLTLSMSASYDGQGDAMEDVVVNFKNEESNTCDV
jgi:transposase-like protein